MHETAQKAEKIKLPTVTPTGKSKLGHASSFSTQTFSFHSTSGVRYGEEQEDFLVYEEFSRSTDSPSVVGQALFNAGIEIGLHALEYNNGGSTATFCYIQENRIFVLQVGDSQAHLISSTKAQRLSEIHQPEFERERITQEGGVIIKPFGKSSLYICNLAVSRSFGERELYRPDRDGTVYSTGITFLPSISMIEIDLQSEHYLFICSDGIGDEIAIEDIQKRILQRGESSLQDCNQALHQSASDRGGDDNRSSIIVDLNALKKKGENTDYLFGVCDGHSGYQISQRVAQVFPQIFREILKNKPESFPGLCLDGKTRRPVFYDEKYSLVQIDRPKALGRSKTNLCLLENSPETQEKRKRAFAKIELARRIAQNLNSFFIWNGREKAAYIFAAINYLLNFLETPDGLVFHEPEESLWRLKNPKANSKSLFEALIWPRWTKPKDDESNSLQTFRNAHL
jgi:serine/threonine protein phosphatase PrpC